MMTQCQQQNQKWRGRPVKNYEIRTCRIKTRLVLLGLFFSTSTVTSDFARAYSFLCIASAASSSRIDNQQNQAISGSHRMVRKLHAPPIIDPHVKELVLHCDYDLHGNELYSVSWYRNDQMLFKYQPSSSPPGIDFQTDSDNQYSPRDVKVLPNKSNATHLLLEGNQDISQENLPRYEGTYTCEVLIERTFLADFAMANVSAAILPKSYPMIEGLSSTYQESAQLDATCSSAPSWPPADLTFLVNGQKVDRKFTREKRVQPAGAIASSSQLTISIPLERYDFPKGELRIVCRATLPGLSTEYKYEREYTAKFEEVDNQRFAQELPSLLSAGFRPTPTFLSLLCVVFSQSMLRNHLGSSWLVIRAESL